jgi:hypothetical protein
MISGASLTYEDARSATWRSACGLGEPIRKSRIVGAEPLDLDPVDRQHPNVGRCPDPRRSRAVRGEQGTLADDRARSKLTCSFRRLNDDVAFENHVEPGAVLAGFDQHAPRRNLRLGADLLEELQIVGVHRGEYRKVRRRSTIRLLGRRNKHNYRAQRPKTRKARDVVIAGGTAESKPRRKWREFVFPSHWRGTQPEPPFHEPPDETEGGAGVREPRRPLPSGPKAGAIALEAPDNE